MRIKTVAGPLLVGILIISPMFAAHASKGRNPGYNGFSCQPTGLVRVGVPIPVELIVFQNAKLKNVNRFDVSVWTYGDIEYSGPTSFGMDLNDSAPTVFPFTVVIKPADDPDSATLAGVTFTLTSGQLNMTMSSFFGQSNGSIAHRNGEPRVANWARLGVPEWAKRPPPETDGLYKVDSVTGKMTKLPPSKPRTVQLPQPLPPDTGYSRLGKLTKIEVAQLKMRKMEMYPLVDEERQFFVIDNVWYVRDKGEKKFRISETALTMEEHRANWSKKREESLQRKTKVVLDLRDSLAYKNAVKILGESLLESTDSAGYYEATIDGYLKIELDEVGITVRRIRSNQKSPKINDRTIMREAGRPRLAVGSSS